MNASNYKMFVIFFCQHIREVVDKFANDKTHKDANCAVLFILSHGGDEKEDNPETKSEVKLH